MSRVDKEISKEWKHVLFGIQTHLWGGGVQDLDEDVAKQIVWRGLMDIYYFAVWKLRDIKEYAGLWERVGEWVGVGTRGYLLFGGKGPELRFQC